MKPISAVWGSDKSVNAYFRGDLVSLVAGYSSALCFNCNSTQALLFEDQRRGRVEAVPPLLFKKDDAGNNIRKYVCLKKRAHLKSL